jgi:hypothetical protein
VEGQTEEAVVRDVLEPYLAARGGSVSTSILATKRPASGGKHRGGVSTWAKIRREVDLLLRDSSLDVLTTMIDYYGLPGDSPGMADRPAGDPYEQVAHVEGAIAAAVGSPRLRPHLVLHETEAWVLAAGGLTAERFGKPQLGSRLGAIVESAGGPERVDDGPQTAPSKRLEQLFPTYDKVVDGPAIIAEAGIESVLAQCPHAREWLESLTG